MPYSARATTSGSAHAIAFTRDLGRDHPEFTTGRFEAHVIAPGRLLISTTSEVVEDAAEADPVLDAFLGFMEKEMSARPDLIRPFTAGDVDWLDELLAGVEVDPDEDLGDDFTLP